MLAVAAATVALSGCNGHGNADASPTLPGAVAPEVAHMMGVCGFGGPTIALSVGWPTCSLSEQTSSAFAFLISGTDFAKLQSGAMFEIGINTATTGVRTAGASEEPLAAGTIEFTTFEPGAGATGSYDVLFAGGTASGRFSADYCPGLICH
jgi:hypothetical protein